MFIEGSKLYIYNHSNESNACSGSNKVSDDVEKILKKLKKSIAWDKFDLL